MQQPDAETIARLSNQLKTQGFTLRSAHGSDIYYITAKQVGLFEIETYCLIFEEEGWRVNAIHGKPGRREAVAATIKQCLEGGTDE